MLNFLGPLGGVMELPLQLERTMAYAQWLTHSLVLIPVGLMAAGRAVEQRME